MGNACGCVDNKETLNQDDQNLQPDHSGRPVSATGPKIDPVLSKELKHDEELKDHSTPEDPVPKTKQAKKVDKENITATPTTSAKPPARPEPVKPISNQNTTGSNHESKHPQQTQPFTLEKPQTPPKKEQEPQPAPQPAPLHTPPRPPVVPAVPEVQIPSPKNQLIKTSLISLGPYQPFMKLERKDILRKEIEKGIFYEGQIKDGKREGVGRLVYENGPIIESHFRNNALEGEGRIIKDNGDVFIGSFVNGKAEGKGRYLRNGCEEYEGEFKADKPHGKGVIKYANGNKYEGGFADGMREGKGRFEFANKDLFEGSFLRGEFHGQGSLR